MTTDTRLYEEYQDFLSSFQIHLVQVTHRLTPPHVSDGRRIIQAKLERAKVLLPGHPVLVHEKTLILRGHAGPRRSLRATTLHKFSVEALLRIAEGQTDRTVKFITDLAYFDGYTRHFERAIEKGHILDEPRGLHTRDWPLSQLYVSDHFSPCTLAQLSEAEWDKYRTTGSDYEAILRLRRSL
ncbi:hypothetical protein I6A60_07110 [Frankia sp. AgB1.9]|uniref:non-canonical purine NTP pyrophosphatase n=1 Tax=unclassified Frankia TaxID=2632575 RepID=UPI001931CD14|nr:MULTISPECIES: non-canonical purine NTP pyrophosphatase [unclassified Frankia]MBL7488409.1 hypothetical protein [Frankia sp. AgW1.1]MBL7547643.1 hypothetical protein [Frankia sp. AgB1.9]